VVRETAELLRPFVGERIELGIAADPDVPKISADRGQIEQVLMNLVTNARDAMPEGGSIVVRTNRATLDDACLESRPDTSAGDYAALIVTDTGSGMDAGTGRRVFEPFFTTKPEGKGTGLGLATVYGIVKQHRGSISVCSEPGVGTTFKVYLPAAVVSAAPDRAPEEPRAPGSSRGSETILVVEDEHSVLRLAGRALKECGYRVLWATRPDEAERLLSKDGAEVELLVADVVMPGMNGPELYERLARRRPALKVLYMSGYPAGALERHGVIDVDANFVGKPVDPETLARKVREVLDGRRAAETGVSA
jgi:CheY-like chemotaxis protein